MTGQASKVKRRMGYVPRALLTGGLGLAASFLVACGGSSGVLSGGQADNLNGQLDRVSQAVDAGQCAAAATAASNFSNAVENLPGSVNQALVTNLQQGAQTINTLAQKDCRSQTTTTTTSSTTSSSSTTTTTTSSTPSSSSSSTTTSSTPTTSSATSSTDTGTSTTSGSGGAGLGGTTTVGGTGGAGPGGGNGQ